jgi:phage-related protein
MDVDERKAAFAEAKERSLVMLDDEACRETIAAETVTRVQHRTDGYSCDWAAGIPKQEEAAPVQRRTTDAESLRWKSYIDGRIEALFDGDRMNGLREAIGAALAHERKQFRAEIEGLRAEIGQLRADLTIHRAHAGQRSTGGESEHTTWMNSCVPAAMAAGKPQDQAVAICMNVWRSNWEETHPGGENDPGPDRPQKVGDVIDLPSVLPARKRYG